MNRFDRFLELIGQPEPAPAADDRTAALVQPLRDLADALAQGAQVGAAVHQSADARRYHLALWPRHRPAYRSLMVTVVVGAAGLTVLGNPPAAFATAEEFTQWLEMFVQLPDFRASLESLRAAAQEPVDARIERANGMATLLAVDPGRQEQLDGMAVGADLDFALELEEGEPVPTPQDLRVLNSAGVLFDVVPGSASVAGRVVQFRAVKR